MPSCIVDLLRCIHGERCRLKPAKVVNPLFVSTQCSPKSACINIHGPLITTSLEPLFLSAMTERLSSFVWKCSTWMLLELKWQRTLFLNDSFLMMATLSASQIVPRLSERTLPLMSVTCLRDRMLYSHLEQMKSRLVERHYERIMRGLLHHISDYPCDLGRYICALVHVSDYQPFTN